MQLVSLFTADQELFVIADGLVVEPDLAEDVLSGRQAVVTIPSPSSLATDYPEDFERIDADRAWAGLARIRGNLVVRLADLPGDGDVTSTDISLIHGGELRMTTDGEVAGHPVMLPMIEINTIGAGAGSIAWLDDRNGLHVGPHSAGADPGPAAYGRGGTEPTVADANIVLGRLHPHRFLGGAMKVDIEAARSAVRERVAEPLGMSMEAAAAGIIRIANANMERAVRVSSAEKGYDPRDIVLLAFGGAGPLHAAALARAARIPTVLVPPQPGVFSAVGLVMADIRHDFVRSQILRGSEITADRLDALFARLDEEAEAALERDAVPGDRRRLRRSADIRYSGQAYEVHVPVPGGTLDESAVNGVVQSFHDLHRQLYAHDNPGRPVEFVSGRVAAIGLMDAPALPEIETRADGVPMEHRRVYFDETRDYVDTAIYDRDALGPRSVLNGPAIVEQMDTTTVVHPGQRATVDTYGNLLISTGD